MHGHAGKESMSPDVRPPAEPYPFEPPPTQPFPEPRDRPWREP